MISPNVQIFVFRVGAGNQDVGGMPQGARAALGGSLGYRIFQLGQE